MKQHFILPASGALLIAIAIVLVADRSSKATHDEWYGRDGEKEAYADIACGKLVLLEYGLYSPLDGERRAVMMTRFKIECREIGGCLVSPSLVAFAEPYNAVMREQIVARYGEDVFDRASKEARDLFESRHASKTG